MTAVNTAAVSSTVGARPSSAGLKTNMDYDSFLKLFMAQMRNQDPTKPNDPTATLSQLASFSNVEQSIRLNDKLDSLLSTSNASLAAGLAGRTVSSLDGSVTGTVTSVSVEGSIVTAALNDGRTLNLADGYRIGQA